MKETTDIQKFQRLFAAWLEAATSLEQEQELLHLARRVSDAGCDDSTLRDAELVMLSIAPRPSKADAGEFGRFLDSLTAPQAQRRPRRKKWLMYAAAAVCAIVVTVGLNMPQTPEPAPIAKPIVTQPQPAPAPAPTALTAKAEQPAMPSKSDLSDLSDQSDQSDQSDFTAKQEPAETEELLVPREITDPQEAAEVLGRSCALLADCVQHAEAESQKALDTFAENINLVNEII